MDQNTSYLYKILCFRKIVRFPEVTKLHFQKWQNSISGSEKTPFPEVTNLRFRKWQNSISGSDKTPFPEVTKLHFQKWQNSISRSDKTPFPEVTKLHFRKWQNSISGSDKTSFLEVTKLHFRKWQNSITGSDKTPYPEVTKLHFWKWQNSISGREITPFLEVTKLHFRKWKNWDFYLQDALYSSLVGGAKLFCSVLFCSVLFCSVLAYQGNRKVFHGARTHYQTIADIFVLVVSPSFSLVQTMMTTTTDRQTDTVTNPLVEASLRDGLIRYPCFYFLHKHWQLNKTCKFSGMCPVDIF